METIRTLEAKLDTCNEIIKQLETSLSKTENALKTYEKECVKLRARFVKIKSRKMIAADF
jgi:predicted nuclease with TOPRIM domain